jgi:O-antigen/teichoic acid export membrane protein
MAKRWQTLRSITARRPELASRVGYNGLAQLAPMLVVLALTPVLLDRLGLDRYGIWAIALVALNTLRILDGGIAASLARFFAVHAAGEDRVAASRLMVGSLLFLALLGVVLTLVALPLAPTLVKVLNMPEGLEGEATMVLRWVPALAALALMGEATAALLVGHNRFRALAATMWLSALCFGLAVVLFVGDGAHLQALMIAVAARYGVLIFANLGLGARHLSLRRPLLPSRADMREVGGYSSRMQLSAISGFVNTELDALIIAAFLPIRYVGLYQIGMQVATGLRSLPLFAFPPLLTRLTTILHLEGREATADEFRRLERNWFGSVLGFGAVAVAAVAFAIPVWLGDAYVTSGAIAAILLAGYTAHVGLTGMRTCFVRAVGRPGLEMRSSIAWTVANLLLTVPLVLLAGVIGVVSATTLAGALASIYFVALCRREEGLPLIAPRHTWWPLVGAGVLLTVVGELLLVQAGLHGYGALVLTGVPAVLGWAVLAYGLRRGRRSPLLPLTQIAAPPAPVASAGRPSSNSPSE